MLRLRTRRAIRRGKGEALEGGQGRGEKGAIALRVQTSHLAKKAPVQAETEEGKEFCSIPERYL